MSEFIQANLIPGTEFNGAAQQQRRQLWQQTGFCQGLTEIGQFTVATTATTALLEVYSRDYNSLYDKNYIDQAGRPRIAYDIEEAFVELVEADLARIDPESRSSFVISDDPLLTWGHYKEVIPDIHTDEGFGANGLRYFSTITGPGTVGVVGKLGPDKFTDNFDLKSGVRVPKKNLRSYVAGRVLRFSTDFDPHTPPTCQEPVFRATIQQTVHKLNESDKSMAGVERISYTDLS